MLGRAGVVEIVFGVVMMIVIAMAMVDDIEYDDESV